MDDANIAKVTILVLGDPGCGKSTLLARINKGRDGHSDGDLVLLRDMDQPFTYHVRLYDRMYYFRFYDTAASSEKHWTLIRPDFVVICFDISDRKSLVNAKNVWKPQATRLLSQNRDNDDVSFDPDAVPIMLLGLKRDLRVDGDDTIYPQEGYRIAQEMRCDCYAECSALFGTLAKEAIEDIMKTGAKTTTANGGQSQGTCIII